MKLLKWIFSWPGKVWKVMKRRTRGFSTVGVPNELVPLHIKHRR